jgi:hypothetical protein
VERAVADRPLEVEPRHRQGEGLALGRRSGGLRPGPGRLLAVALSRAAHGATIHGARPPQAAGHTATGTRPVVPGRAIIAEP